MLSGISDRFQFFTASVAGGSDSHVSMIGEPTRYREVVLTSWDRACVYRGPHWRPAIDTDLLCVTSNQKPKTKIKNQKSKISKPYILKLKRLALDTHCRRRYPIRDFSWLGYRM